MEKQSTGGPGDRARSRAEVRRGYALSAALLGSAKGRTEHDRRVAPGPALPRWPGITGRVLLVLGSLFRLAVGAGYLASPDRMAHHQLAPDIRAIPMGG
jgi:hypothetical protein